MHSLKASQEQLSRWINWPNTLLVVFLAALVTIIILIKGKHIRYDQRGLNKRYLNPLMLKLAGHRYSPQAIVYHKGRKSGRIYTTPVVVAPIASGFIIPLPYGTGVDWYRNILAAGQCTIQWQGNNYTIIEPELIDAEAAKKEISLIFRWWIFLFNPKEVLKVHISSLPDSGSLSNGSQED